MDNVTFTMADIGRGIKAVYCWTDEFSDPAAYILFKQEDPRVERITIISKRSSDKENERRILVWLQERCSLIIYPFWTTESEEIGDQIALLSAGFRFDNKSISFIWTRDENAILPSKTTDMSIGKLLGGSHFKENKEGILFGISPFTEIKEEEEEDEKSIDSKLVEVPRWSREKAQSLGLLFELKEAYSFDTIFKQTGSFHFVSISDRESNVVSGAHSEINGAIADVIIRYLVERSNREALKEKSKGETENAKCVQS